VRRCVADRAHLPSSPHHGDHVPRGAIATLPGEQVALRANRAALVAQNDGDEMLTARAAFHLTMCEPSAPPPYYGAWRMASPA
jgi:hypothetical protein